MCTGSFRFATSQGHPTCARTLFCTVLSYRMGFYWSILLVSYSTQDAVSHKGCTHTIYYTRVVIVWDPENSPVYGQFLGWDIPRAPHVRLIACFVALSRRLLWGYCWCHTAHSSVTQRLRTRNLLHACSNFLGPLKTAMCTGSFRFATSEGHPTYA